MSVVGVQLVTLLHGFHACRYDAIIHGRHTQGYITNELQQHWQNGVRVSAAPAWSRF